ncbi:MAG: acylglycerol lipase [Planctomycetota bacterium]|jgi:acylglycerol lipase
MEFLNKKQKENLREFNFKLHNTKFYGQMFEPAKVEAILLVVHGMGEHIGRYGTHFAKAFNNKNIAVVGFDQFGHGKTEGKRGHTPGYDANLDSIDKMLEEIKDYYGDKIPVFLYGHSMGGNLVANYVLRRQSNIKGALISSPMLRLAFDPPAWKMKVGGWLRNIYPTFTESSGLDLEAISRDKAARDKYAKDPLVHDKVTINYTLPFFDAGEWAIINAGILNKKVFIFHGTGDRITDHKATADYAMAADKNATLKLYEGGYHELHNDLCKEEVLKDMTDWIETFLYDSFML